MCKISIIGTGLFRGLDKLEVLDLDNNQLVTLDGTVFVELNKLERVSLIGNHISSIDIRDLADLPKLTYLFLDENPLSPAQLNTLKAALPNVVLSNR